MTEVLMLAFSVAELQTIRALCLVTKSACLLAHQLHEGSVSLGTIPEVLPLSTVLKTIGTSADVAGFGTVRSHVSVAVLTFASVGPLLTPFVLVHTLSTVITIVLWN